MMIRDAVVAGEFYPCDPGPCRTEVARLLAQADRADTDPPAALGGLVPHAGWACSGAVAARVFSALAASRQGGPPPATVVLLGGTHRHRGREVALFPNGRWETPIGAVEVDQRLAERISGHTNLICEDPYAHEREHSIEVQLPFVRHLYPDARIVPIMVPPTPEAATFGRVIGTTLKSYRYDALLIGTTDLTHYGPNYGHVGHGIGPDGNRWAKEENDTRFLQLVCAMRADRLVPEAKSRRNACSAGAAAATVAALKVLGATRGTVLAHTTSAEVRSSSRGSAESDSVGYAGVVFS